MQAQTSAAEILISFVPLLFMSLMLYPLTEGGFKWRIPWAINPLLCALGATVAGHGSKVILFLALFFAPIQGVIFAWSRHLGARKKALREKSDALEAATSL